MRKEPKSWDYAKNLTKDELIQYLKDELWNEAPTKRDIITVKYEIHSKRAQKLLDIMISWKRSYYSEEYKRIQKEYRKEEALENKFLKQLMKE